MRARITGTGRSVPEKVLTNADFEKMVDTTDEWITTRTGIKERHIATEDEALSDFAIPAAKAALEMAGVAGEQVDLVIVATVTSDRTFPATSSIVQDAIGAKGAAAFDLSAACTGFIYGLGVAQHMIAGGAARNAVIVGGEVLSKIVDYSERATAVLFGDGAGAVVLSAVAEDDEVQSGLLSVKMHSDGSLGDLIDRPGGGSRNPINSPSGKAGENGHLGYLRMRGNETFKVAVRTLAQVSKEVLAACDLDATDVNWFIPHQANLRIIDAVGQRLHIPEGRTYINVERYGNTSAASIPIALDELNRDGRIAAGDVVLLSAFGSGLTWGAGLVRW
ncbi:MAG: ketoacyl-ACP synthase III [Acidobacteriota bacterium]|nr:ketoacyl-ACP synthase III [Acidobacteriota bacterium]